MILRYTYDFKIYIRKHLLLANENIALPPLYVIMDIKQKEH